MSPLAITVTGVLFIMGIMTTVIGYLFVSAHNALKQSVDRLEVTFTRVSSGIVSDVRQVDTKLDSMDRRLTRIESWRELVTLPTSLPNREEK